MDSLTPSDITRNVLRQLVQRYGADISGDVMRCQGLLKDFCPDPACNRTIVAVLHAVREGVGGLSQGNATKSALPIAVSVARLSRQIYDKHAIDESLARWAVISWCLVLGVVSDAEAAQLESVAHAAAPPPTPAPATSTSTQKNKALKSTPNSKPPSNQPAQGNSAHDQQRKRAQSRQRLTTTNVVGDTLDLEDVLCVEDDTQTVSTGSKQPAASKQTVPQPSSKPTTTKVGEAFIAAVVMGGIITALTLVIDRILGGGWRSAWSITSSFTMCALGVFGLVASADSEHDSLGAGIVFGGLAGLLYGFATASILPGAFYGGCVGVGTTFLVKRVTTISNPVILGVAVLGALYGFHVLGMLPPTKLVR